jgi:delta8-fatty-acid desaturase
LASAKAAPSIENTIRLPISPKIPLPTLVPQQQQQQQRQQQQQVSWNDRISVKGFDKAIDDMYSTHTQTLEQDGVYQPDMTDVRRKYQALEQDLRDRGLFECNRYRYGKECCRFLGLLYVVVWFALRGTGIGHHLVSAICLALLWHQLVFTAHDAGHNAITGKVATDHCIGVIIANFFGGLSLGWWKDSHHVHHIKTNEPEHDPDIQHLPFLAVTPRFFQGLFSTYYNRLMDFDGVSRFFVAHQHRLYYLLLAFGRFNLHVMSFRYLLTSKRIRSPRMEWIGIGVFFLWYGALLAHLPTVSIRIMYVLVSYILTCPLHVQITLSHFGMSNLSRPGENFPAHQLRTTMDIECPAWLDWWYGGLQYQVVHHLFPRLPRHHFVLAVPLVQQFCKDAGLRYYLYSFATGNGVVLGGLKAVADQVRLLRKVADHNANSSILGHGKDGSNL